MLMRYMQYFDAFLNLFEFRIIFIYLKRKKNHGNYTNKIFDKAKLKWYSCVNWVCPFKKDVFPTYVSEQRYNNVSFMYLSK